MNHQPTQELLVKYVNLLQGLEKLTEKNRERITVSKHHLEVWRQTIKKERLKKRRVIFCVLVFTFVFSWLGALFIEIEFLQDSLLNFATGIMGSLLTFILIDEFWGKKQEFWRENEFVLRQVVKADRKYQLLIKKCEELKKTIYSLNQEEIEKDIKELDSASDEAHVSNENALDSLIDYFYSLGLNVTTLEELTIKLDVLAKGRNNAKQQPQ